MTQGEYSFVFFRRAFAYAVHKQPPPGEYRSQPHYGAVHLPYAPTAHELAQAGAVLDAAARVCDGAALPLYARVDLARASSATDCSDFVLMELELIEPHLYVPHDGADGARAAASFADAVAAALAETQREREREEA